MPNWQRIFAFVSGSIVIGLLLIVVSHNFIQYVANKDNSGYYFLIGFGLVFLSLNIAFSRRYTVKAVNTAWVCFLMAFFILLPTVFWVYTKDVGLGKHQLAFVSTIIFAALLGTLYGIRKGKIKRKKYIRRLQEEQEDQDLPESLKRSHDDLNIN